jgi:geranyl-CoA carboxylase alpha subunit
MKRLLVANRGEIARRVMHTAQRMGIETVAVFSDADAGAMHVREATFSFALGGNASSESYLRVDKLLAAARASGADALHPGYGFLSENADFAQAVIDAGLLWVGPPPAAIRALGNKANAKQLALRQCVPCLDGYQGADQSDQRFALEAARIGYPVMVKASAGGGGRGMRLVLAADQLPAALRSARSEALSSFGSAELLVERALLAPRHVEVQVFADQHGHCIHLGERDCSVQRRHQKIIEESPSPALDAALRERMGACAVALALGAGYVGAGTVEFLVEDSVAGGPDPGPPPEWQEKKRFYLMEMNTRLQVEHPVTEMLTGLDLVEWQLRVARGEPLPLRQEQVLLQGHAIEVRLCAEDENFAPHAGRVLRFDEPLSALSLAHNPAVRFDHALFEGAHVPPHYDSMLGKLIARGSSRAEAILHLRAALVQTCVLGLPTNRALLGACLAHPTFGAGCALIPFLAEQGEGLRATLRDQEERLLLPCALAMYYANAQARAMVLACTWPRPLRLRWRDRTLDLDVSELGLGRLRVEHAGRQHEGMLSAGEAGALRLTLDGATHRVFSAHLPDGRWHMQCDGVDLWLQDASFEPAERPGQASAADALRAPFNGKLLVLHAISGAQVRRGDPLAVIESMKLEHVLGAPRDGRIGAVLVQPGQQVATGQLLMSLEAA